MFQVYVLNAKPSVIQDPRRNRLTRKEVWTNLVESESMHPAIEQWRELVVWHSLADVTDYTAMLEREYYNQS